jgi:hypothetical protein
MVVFSNGSYNCAVSAVNCSLRVETNNSTQSVCQMFESASCANLWYVDDKSGAVSPVHSTTKVVERCSATHAHVGV